MEKKVNELLEKSIKDYEEKLDSGYLNYLSKNLNSLPPITQENIDRKNAIEEVIAQNTFNEKDIINVIQSPSLLADKICSIREEALKIQDSNGLKNK